MSSLEYVSLRQRPELVSEAAEWFHSRWGVPVEAYLECMMDCLENRTDYDWFLALDEGKIVAGLGIIENDFHERKDLHPNVCAVYTEEAYRGQGIAGQLLNMAVAQMKEKGIRPLYLLTDHTEFYERYGWQFLCFARNEDGESLSRVYVHY
ncbi:MAG: GNAT family N-acetyltransferase [Erysipelotrichaceae bacterium]|nr:GNAT family N-acetyltransferase [Erysipelotrichaceae bacterium]